MAHHATIIDCDPGQDDAINLLLALSSPDEIDVLGITTVAGNVPLDLTTRNARLMCDLAGFTDMPVYAGCDQPVVRELITAENVHGSTGIDGVEISTPRTPLQEQHAVDFIIETLTNAVDDSITLVPTGPLTNVAVAITREPEILQKIKRIVMMGGAMGQGGNTSPSAEFNMLVDPHAAKIVFECGRPIVTMGLDVTHQVLASRSRIATLRALDNPVADATCDMLEFFSRHDSKKYGADGAPLHDPCTMAFLLRPAIFSGKECNISVETESPLTMGHTAVDFWRVTDRPINATWIHHADADAFYDLLADRLSRYSKN
ncbi:MAG: nucleoside hydrolase [Gammaproteobacteria bacterium]|nr:nucleoside hydrolase [Gammaproteobacteria bacterium]NNF59954.1 nucleoside hydrolase [Gammaproteobacteria bacterium]NNM19682.1 nucleoside hydrolase [Gammaproteobacteria bacterium]